jgi:broad specificity phosphatase PhoE
MTEQTLVHLMRHGEVDNPTGVLYGRLPGYVLSELGHRMAIAVAESVRGRDVVHVVASPLERAQQTAKPIAAEFGLTVLTDERLIEAQNIFEGLTFGVGDGSLRRPAHWKHLRNPFRPSWGEPYRAQVTRMLTAMADARDAARGREAICVSHQLPIWAVRSFVEGRRLWHDPRKRECTLASMTTFTYTGDEITEVTYTEPAKALLPPKMKKFVAGA